MSLLLPGAKTSVYATRVPTPASTNWNLLLYRGLRTTLFCWPGNLAWLRCVEFGRIKRMTARLYYDDSFLYEFDAQVMEIVPASQAEARPAVVLDRPAFYPPSGGQVFDTGWIAPADASGEGVGSEVVEVTEREDGTILHLVHDAAPLS